MDFQESLAFDNSKSGFFYFVLADPLRGNAVEIYPIAARLRSKLRPEIMSKVSRIRSGSPESA